MARYIGHVTSPRPIEDVFDYLADFSNCPRLGPERHRVPGPSAARRRRRVALRRPPASWGERCRSPMR